jgi:hypothetical protein
MKTNKVIEKKIIKDIKDLPATESKQLTIRD